MPAPDRWRPAPSNLAAREPHRFCGPHRRRALSPCATWAYPQRVQSGCASRKVGHAYHSESRVIHAYPCCLTLAQRRSPLPTNEASAPRSSNSNWRPAARSSRTATSSRSHSRRDRSHLAPPKTHTMAASDPASRFARRASRAPERATRPKLPTHTNELVGDGPVRALPPGAVLTNRRAR